MPVAWCCAVLKDRRGGLSRFPVAMARGKHLFPFRTEQLSPSAPMVLGSQEPGRVGRRRFYVRKSPATAGLFYLLRARVRDQRDDEHYAGTGSAHCGWCLVKRSVDAGELASFAAGRVGRSTR